MLTNETEANPAACGKGSINRLVLSTTEHGVFNIVLFKKQHWLKPHTSCPLKSAQIDRSAS
jgi:hypothetical protein